MYDISMKISLEEQKRLEAIYQEFLHHPKILKMKEISMHRGSNCYEHSFKVAKLAVKMASRHKKLNVELVLLGSILHDYYLYDWRNDKSLAKWHGHKHPYLAAKQAEEDFHISPEVKKLISCHMWPLNFFNFPDSEEARILTFADKIIAIKEAFTSKKYKKKNREKVLEYISHLFSNKN